MSYQPNYNNFLDEFESMQAEVFDQEIDFDEAAFEYESAEAIELTDEDFGDASQDSIGELAEQISDELEGMTEAEAKDYLEAVLSSEAFPLIPLIAALAPLAPMAIQAVSGLVNNAMNQRPAPRPAPAPRRAPAPQSRPPQSQAPRPATRPAPRPVTLQPAVMQQAPAPAQHGTPAGNPIASLLGLLQNPAVLNVLSSAGNAVTSGVSNIQNLAGAGIGAAAQLAQDPQLMGLLLQTISQLANNARSEMYGETIEEYPEFLFDAEGNLVADPYAPEQVAEIILDHIN